MVQLWYNRDNTWIDMKLLVFSLCITVTHQSLYKAYINWDAALLHCFYRTSALCLQCFCIKKDSPFIIRFNFSSFLFISFHFIILNILTIFFIIINMSNNTLSAVIRGAKFENQVLNKLKDMNINGTLTRWDMFYISLSNLLHTPKVTLPLSNKTMENWKRIVAT